MICAKRYVLRTLRLQFPVADTVTIYNRKTITTTSTDTNAGPTLNKTDRIT